ncbi:hypothetical protein DXG03_007857 [Asterophora parasitica]|uniref:Uncharacterized protein n=1 Tax=Asterophora parasitica TaxID=117018 RepID=A0A9P7KBM9_9AGAR|nr:hypothetical protein DXG03_007857 [Asterophora parasitica]
MDVDANTPPGSTQDRASKLAGSSQNPPAASEPPLDPSKPGYRLRYTLSGHTRSISSLKFSPDGAILASSSSDKLIKLWDVYTGEIIRTFEGHKEGISDVAWSSDGDYLASASDDKTIIIWSLALVRDLSNLLVSGGFDETVRVWDVARGPKRVLYLSENETTKLKHLFK